MQIRASRSTPILKGMCYFARAADRSARARSGEAAALFGPGDAGHGSLLAGRVDDRRRHVRHELRVEALELGDVRLVVGVAGFPDLFDREPVSTRRVTVSLTGRRWITISASSSSL